MKSNNHNLNPKQQELIERLEEIRRRRMSTEPINREPVSGDNTPRKIFDQPADSDEQDPEYLSRKYRNRNRNQRRSSTSRPATGARRTRNRLDSDRKPNVQPQQTVESYEYREGYPERTMDDYARQRVNRPSLRKQDKISSKRSKNFSENLVKSLSDEDRLREAIILNEVLSVPVALRKRYM